MFPLLLLALVILLYAWRSQLQLFVYPGYIFLVIGGALILLLLALVGLWRPVRLPWSMSLVLLVIAVAALLVPPRPLSDATAQSRGIQGLQTNPRPPVFQFALNTASMELLDWLRLLGSDPAPERFEGDALKISGMIVDERPGDREIHITRYIISCCLADARPVGLRMTLPENLPMPGPGTWVRAEGTMSFDGGVPVVRATHFDSIPAPADPYAYF